MVDESHEQSSRTLSLALAVLAAVGWLAAGFIWWQGGQTQSYLTEQLTTAERARQSVASDLQNLEKTAGAAADLKKQAADAEKALSEASTARASAQNELADLTKQISDARLVISGAQEEASARTRDLQAVDARFKDESDHVAALQSQDQSPFGRIDPVAGRRRRCTQGSRGCSDPDRFRAKGVRGLAKPDQLGDRRAQRASSANSRGEVSNGLEPKSVTRIGPPMRLTRLTGDCAARRRVFKQRTDRQFQGRAGN